MPNFYYTEVNGGDGAIGDGLIYETADRRIDGDSPASCICRDYDHVLNTLQAGRAHCLEWCVRIHT